LNPCDLCSKINLLIINVLCKHVIGSAVKYLNKNESNTQTLRGALGDNTPTWVVISIDVVWTKNRVYSFAV